jgi:hypothetical protein
MMQTFKKRIPLKERIQKVYVYDISCPSDSEIADLHEYFYDEYMSHKDIYNFMVVKCNDEEEKFEFEYYISDIEVLNKYKTFKMFTKADRSSFKYWFAHWCGFQLTALNLGIWKPKYLLHDIEKPWLKLLWKGDYKRVQKWHRIHNRHHLEYGLKYGWDKIDWEALMIDWECCGLSKQEAQLDARETLEYEIKRDKWKPYAKEIESRLGRILYKYNL